MDLEALHEKYVTLKLEIPALKESNEHYERALRLKEDEVRQHIEAVTKIENRWKNNTKEPHKFTAKTIL